MRDERLIRPSSERTSGLNELVNRVVINPQTLLNRGLLFTSQCWIDNKKLTRLLNTEAELLNALSSTNDADLPQAWVLERDNKRAYVIGDGNHRVALCCLLGINTIVKIVGPWSGEKLYGFNIILSKVRAELRGYNF